MQYPGFPCRDSSLTGLEHRLDSLFTNTPDKRCDSPLTRLEPDIGTCHFTTKNDLAGAANEFPPNISNPNETEHKVSSPHVSLE